MLVCFDRLRIFWLVTVEDLTKSLIIVILLFQHTVILQKQHAQSIIVVEIHTKFQTLFQVKIYSRLYLQTIEIKSIINLPQPVKQCYEKHETM